MSKVKIDTYVHGSKEEGNDIAEDLIQKGVDLSEKASNALLYINYEVKLTHEIDTETGDSKIIAVDGRPVMEEEDER